MDFNCVYKELFKPVYAYILLRAKDRNIAEEISAKTWQRVFDKQEKFNPQKGNLTQWIFTIARNETNSYFRLYYLRKVFSLSAFEEDLKDSSQDIENEAQNKDLQYKLQQAMAELKPSYRDILALKFYSGMTNAEIAQTLHITPNNVSTILNRAMNKLKLKLEAENVLQ